jgi:hypothetical protein
MSELTLFRNAKAVIPAHLRQGTDEMTRRLAGGGSGNKRISIRGNVFRMFVDGKEVAKSEERSMDIVIVNAAENVSRQYYEGVYKEGEAKAPDCWSADGIKPDPKAANVQSTACATCPMNIKGSGQGDSRACRYQQRLAVVMANNIENSDVYQLILPAQSLFGKGTGDKMPLQQYAKFLNGHGLGVRSVITEIRFDTNSATPKLTFRAVEPLDEDQFAIVVEKAESEDAINAITMSAAQMDGAKPAAPKLAAPAPAPAPVVKPVLEEEEDAPAPVVREKKSAVPAAPANDLNSVLDAWGDDDE